MELGAVEIIVLALLAFIAMISISMGIRVHRGELDEYIQSKGLSFGNKKTSAEYDVKTLRKRRAVEFFAFGAGLLVAGASFLIFGILAGLAVAIIVPAITLLLTRTRIPIKE